MPPAAMPAKWGVMMAAALGMAGGNELSAVGQNGY